MANCPSESTCVRHWGRNAFLPPIFFQHFRPSTALVAVRFERFAADAVFVPALIPLDDTPKNEDDEVWERDAVDEGATRSGGHAVRGRRGHGPDVPTSAC